MPSILFAINFKITGEVLYGSILVLQIFHSLHNLLLLEEAVSQHLFWFGD